MSATDWATQDAREIDRILSDMPAPTLPADFSSINWRGVAPCNRRLNPEPSPSPGSEQPTIFLVPELAYDHRAMTPCFGDAPVREGAVTLFGHIDMGAGIAFFTEGVFPALLAAFGSAQSDRLVFFLDAAIPLPDGAQGDWFLHGLQIPFMGT